MAMFKLTIVTPEGKFQTHQLTGLSLPTADGIRTILANHMQTVIPVEIGVIKLISDKTTKLYSTSEGLFHFEDNKAQLLVSSFEKPEEIDLQRAQRSQERAQKRLQLKEENLDIARAEASLKRALSRQKIIK